MNPETVRLLRCPASQQPLELHATEYAGHRVRSGTLSTPDGTHSYEIRECVPRFVALSNYAANFGMQWNKFSRTQLDSHSGHSISADRFWKSTNWRAEDLGGQRVLDVGCGAGRFAEVALRAGASVVAMDYSTAADACFANLRDYPKLDVIQADVYALPFTPEAFRFVYSLGVLQHTPDPENAFFALPKMLQPGGCLAVDFYEKSLKSLMHPKYWLRPVTKRIRKERLFGALERLVPVLLPVSNAMASVPVIGYRLKQIVPVANYRGELPLTDTQLSEWALLDTFDWLSPAFDNPQSRATLAQWLDRAGLEKTEALKLGHIVGRGCKRQTS